MARHLKLILSVPRSKHTLSLSVIETSQVMLCKEIIAVLLRSTQKNKYTVWAERRIIYKDPVRAAQ